MEIGFAVCGSFCTYSIVFPVMEQLSREHHVTPIFSDAAYSVDSRFGTAREHIAMADTICGTPPLHTLAQVEPVGPKKLFDILIIAPLHRKYAGKARPFHRRHPGDHGGEKSPAQRPPGARRRVQQ